METEGSLGRDSSAAGTAAAGGKVTDRGADGSPFTSPVCLPAAGMKIIYERQRASAPLSPPDKSEGRSRVGGSAPRAAPRRARSTIRLVLKVREAPKDGKITKTRAVLHHSQGGDDTGRVLVSHLTLPGPQMKPILFPPEPLAIPTGWGIQGTGAPLPARVGWTAQLSALPRPYRQTLGNLRGHGMGFWDP